jgi:hypothetical protein
MSPASCRLQHKTNGTSIKAESHIRIIDVLGVSLTPPPPQEGWGWSQFQRKQKSVFFFLHLLYKEGLHLAAKKENQIFLIYKEIQMGSVAKSYMREGS